MKEKRMQSALDDRLHARLARLTSDFAHPYRLISIFDLTDYLPFCGF